MNKIFRIILLSVIAVLIMQSCYKERLKLDKVKVESWEADWAFPLAKSELSLKGVLGDSMNIIQTDEQGFISLVYQNKHFIQLDAQEYINIEDISSTVNYEYSLPLIPIGTTFDLPSITLFVPLEVDGKRIDSLLLDGGTLLLTLNSDLNKNQASLSITIPSLRDENYNPLEIPFDLSNASGNLITLEKTQDLSNYRIVTVENDDTQNLEIVLNLSVTGDTNPDNSPYTMDFSFQFQNLETNTFFGYTGKQSHGFQDTINLDIFNSALSGNIDFGENSLHFILDAQNSFGIPLDLGVGCKTIRTLPPASEMNLYFFGEGNSQYLPINYPNMNEVGVVKETHMDADNSNISEVIDLSPQYVIFEIQGTLNPEDDPTISNFVHKDSKFNADFTIQMDLFGLIDGFILTDTLTLPEDIPSQLTDVELLFSFENGFPLGATLEITFVPFDGIDIESFTTIEEGYFLEPAPVSGPPEYRVTEPSIKGTSLHLDSEVVNNFKDYEKIIIRSVISTTNGELVKIYDDYHIKINVGAKFKTRIDI